MSIINKNKICLNYLIGVLICGFVIYANYIYKMENGTGYTTIMSFALLISVTTLSIFNKNNRLFVNMISTLVSTFCLGNLVRSVAIGGMLVLCNRFILDFRFSPYGRYSYNICQ